MTKIVSSFENEEPSTKEKEIWKSITFSFIATILLSIVLFIFLSLIKDDSSDYNFYLISIICIGILMIISLVWFLSSIRSKDFTKKEWNSVFRSKNIFDLEVLIYGIFFGVLGGGIFAGTIEGLIIGDVIGSAIFYVLWGIGFTVIYSLVMIIIKQKLLNIR